MANTWKAETISIDSLSSKIKAEKIVVPPYQRNIVWNQDRKDNLIDSIKKGLPFGSLLIHRKNNQDELIDGLQRTSTISEFINNPTKFFNDEDIIDGDIYKVFELLKINNSEEIIKQKLNNLLLEWIKSYKNMSELNDIQYVDFVDKISEEFPTAKENSKQIRDAIMNTVQNYVTICRQIQTTELPVLIYEGDENLLPEIFERINSKGTPLSKQQIYAAKWSKGSVNIINDKLLPLIDKVVEMYNDRIKNDITISDYDEQEFRDNKTLNFYELIYGFGKYISELYPHLFDNNENASISFNLVNACLKKKNNEVKNLDKNIISEFKNDEEINEFLLKIINCIKTVDKATSKVTKFKGNKRIDSKIKPLHSEMQITSIIASVFLSKHYNIIDDKSYEINLASNNKGWRKFEKAFKKNILKFYIVDILNQKWRGSGDGKLNNIIEAPQTYSRDMDKEYFIENIILWYKTNIDERKENKKVASVKDVEKILLNAIYVDVFSAGQQLDDSKYDIDHILPKNLLKKKLEDINNKYNCDLKLPISSIGNLCLLPECENRKKKDNIIYKDDKYINNSKISKGEIENKFMFYNERDLKWIEEELEPNEFEREYIDFMNMRFEKLLDKLVTNIYDN